MEITYNCENENIEITPAIEGIIEFGVNFGCGENISLETFCQDGTTVNFISAVGFISNYTLFYNPECADPPGIGCNTCPLYATLNYGVTLDLTKVVSVTGTVTINDNGVITVTPITSLAYFAAVHSLSPYFFYEITYDLHFVATNGIVFHFESTQESTGQTCDLDNYDVVDSYDYECLNSYSNIENYSIIDIPLKDGFYTAYVNGEYVCFLVECEPLNCKIYNAEDCTDNLDLFTWYLSFKYCEDCCTKYLLYKKIYAELNKCTTC